MKTQPIVTQTPYTPDTYTYVYMYQYFHYYVILYYSLLFIIMLFIIIEPNITQCPNSIITILRVAHSQDEYATPSRGAAKC